MNLELPESPFIVDTYDTDTCDTTIVVDSVEDNVVDKDTTIVVDSISKKLKESYGNRTTLLSKIIAMYKFIFKEEKKQIWEKTASDVNDDVASAKYNLDLDKIVKESYAEIYNAEQLNKLVKKKITMIPAFLDFCYIYYVTYFDENCPFYKLPISKLKYRVIATSLRAYGNEQLHDINILFEKIIDDEFFKELRIEYPPFCLRTELTDAEIREKLNTTVKSTCKVLLDKLLKL